MLDNYYDSYGYKMPEHFVTTAEIKKVKFAPANHIEQNLTEIGSFFSETGQETGALSQSPLFYKKGEKKNNGGGGGSWVNPYPDATITLAVSRDFSVRLEEIEEVNGGLPFNRIILRNFPEVESAILNASLNDESVSDYTFNYAGNLHEYSVQAPKSRDMFKLPAKIYINGNLWTTIVANSINEEV